MEEVLINTAPAPSQQVLSASAKIDTPAYVIEEEGIERNCQILQSVTEQSGAKIVLAQKAFALPHFYPLIGRYLHGACASGPWEARLAREHFPADSEVLTCAPAYSDADVETLLPLTNHLDFNSVSQWKRFREQCLSYRANSKREIQFGLRINPEHSTGEVALYDPCASGSRLGVTYSTLNRAIEEGHTVLDGLSGLHFHTLCEQGYADLEATMLSVLEKFGAILERPEMTYLNIGGGHWITKDGYDREGLTKLLRFLQERYQLQIYLEPGEAVAIHSGVLVGTVLDIVASNSREVASNVILDLSATAHMPDVLEMPYRPDVYRVDGEQGREDGEYLYQLGGNTCLAGDQIGEYTFSQPLVIGEKLIFNDMAHYTMVKSTFFNGVQSPAIYGLKEDKTLECLREFFYSDYLGTKVHLK